MAASVAFSLPALPVLKLLAKLQVSYGFPSPPPSLLCRFRQPTPLALPFRPIQRRATCHTSTFAVLARAACVSPLDHSSRLLTSSLLKILRGSPAAPHHGKPPRLLARDPQTATSPPSFPLPHPRQHSPCRPVPVPTSLSWGWKPFPGFLPQALGRKQKPCTAHLCVSRLLPWPP